MKFEVRNLTENHKMTHLLCIVRLPTSNFALSSYIYSGTCNFFVVDSLKQKTIYESPKNSPGLCYPDYGAFIL